MGRGRGRGKAKLFWSACPCCTRLHECRKTDALHGLQCSDCLTSFMPVRVSTISLNHYNSNSNSNSTITDTHQTISLYNGHDEKFRRRNGSNKRSRAGNSSRKREQSDSEEDPCVKIVNPGLIQVQDSDFHDFDKDRMENCFEENQLWAIYDDDDGMPRYYAVIQKIMSLRPFKVQMGWLERKDDDNEDLIKWANGGFWRSCGEFLVGKKTTTEFLNVFSHVMKGERADGGLVKIFPKKGSVWALYKDWQSDWDDCTPKEVRYKYEIVEVVTDFRETLGGSVVPLVKFDGFKCVYCKKQIGCQAVKWVLRNEYIRFSHEIPARRLLGNEAQHLPTGCWELDPAAIPTGID